MYHPKKKYNPYGTFTTFENYNVEVRERVKCISGREGVPVSIQWEPRGFYYPTQIAQFGLAHYSKNITEPEPRRKIIYDGEKYLDNWIVSQDASMSREFDPQLQSNVMKFSTSDQMPSQVWLKLNITQDFLLSLDLFLKPNSTMTVVLQNKDRKETMYLHYVCSNNLVAALVSVILWLVMQLLCEESSLMICEFMFELRGRRVIVYYSNKNKLNLPPHACALFFLIFFFIIIFFNS